MAELPPSLVVPEEVPPSQEQGGPEAAGRQFFIWALVAGFIPVCGLPVVWGLAMLGRASSASPIARRWSRRLMALAMLDTLVALASLHLAVTGRRSAEAGRPPSGPQKVLGVVTDPEYPGPGVRLAEVDPRGPAQAAGLQVGDLIHRVEDTPVDSTEALRVAIQTPKPEVGLQLEVEHEGVRREASVLPVEAPSLAPPPRGLFEPVTSAERARPREVRKEWIGTGLVMVALVVLWAIGRRRGADLRPLGVLAVLVGSGLGALVTMRGLSAVLGGPSRGVALLSVWAQALLVVLASWLIVRRGSLGTEAPGRDWLQTYFVSLGLFIGLGMRVLMLLGWLSQVVAASPEKNAHPLMEMARQGPMGVLGWVLLIIPAALFAPVGEELLFRGVLLPWLSGWMGRVAALVVSAGLFASLHLFYGVFAVWIFFLGLMLGWARLTSGELRAPILLHATVNSFGLLMLARSLAG